MAISLQNEGMSELIAMVNKLQDAFSGLEDTDLNLELPMIAVVGSQSAGKSSVLENFVGRDFLPRGAGIVTRRPLILQLVTAKEEYGVFLHKGDEKFHNFEKIRDEIQRDTDHETGGTKNISPVPINLKVYSPNVLNLTLVDLPGLTRVPIGDQPKDIVSQIRTLVLQYITKANCLILAVSPANSDLANSDALKLAQDVDPQGDRTIGVITKLDLMDQGTDARDILDNKLFRLKRGFIGVVNRSQKDIDSRKDIRSATEAERQFFMKHAAYRPIIDRLGTPYLQRTLNTELAHHIARHLPSLRRRLEGQQRDLEKELTDLERLDVSDPARRTRVVGETLQAARHLLDADLDGLARHVPLDTLTVGAAVASIFEMDFPQQLKKREPPRSQLAKEVVIAIRNARAIKRGFYTPDKAFEHVSRAQIELMRQPCRACVNLVAKQLQNIVERIAETAKDFPAMRERLNRLLTARLRQAQHDSTAQLDFFVDCQKGYINTNSRQFTDACKKTKNDGLKSDAARANVESLLPPSAEWSVSRTTKVSYKNTSKSYPLTLDRQFFIITQKGEPAAPIPLSQLAAADCGTHINVARQGGTLVKDWKSFEIREHVADWRDAFVKVKLLQAVGVSSAESSAASDKRSAVFGDAAEDPEVAQICSMVHCYVELMHNIIVDITPKIIVKSLVFALIDYVPTALYVDLLNECSLEQLLREGSDVTERRTHVCAALQTTKTALQIIRSGSVGKSSLFAQRQIRDVATVANAKNVRNSILRDSLVDAAS